MRFLIIDDCDYKINNIKRYFENQELDISKSYNDGMRKLISNKYDGLILDMQFPVFEEELWNTDPEQGIRILARLERRKINIPTVVYSSNRKNVYEYRNVKDYILSDECCIADKVERFIKLCEKIKREGDFDECGK